MLVFLRFEIKRRNEVSVFEGSTALNFKLQLRLQTIISFLISFTWQVEYTAAPTTTAFIFGCSYC